MICNLLTLDYLASIDLVLKDDEEKSIPTFVRNLPWKTEEDRQNNQGRDPDTDSNLEYPEYNK